jgi:hypothetical protein
MKDKSKGKNHIKETSGEPEMVKTYSGIQLIEKADLLDDTHRGTEEWIGISVTNAEAAGKK